MYCPECGFAQPGDHRFCISCGARLPMHLLQRGGGPKESEWFLGIPVVPDDPPRSALRVSRYLEEFEATTPEGSVRVPSHHVRFSTWVDDRVVAAVSLADDEARRAAEFLLACVQDETTART